MAAIAQTNLFSWDAIEPRSDLDRLRLVVDHLPDERLVQYLEVMRAHGRDDYPVRAMWNALLAGIVFQHESLPGLRGRTQHPDDYPRRLGHRGDDGHGAWPYPPGPPRTDALSWPSRFRRPVSSHRFRQCRSIGARHPRLALACHFVLMGIILIHSACWPSRVRRSPVLQPACGSSPAKALTAADSGLQKIATAQMSRTEARMQIAQPALRMCPPRGYDRNARRSGDFCHETDHLACLLARDLCRANPRIERLCGG
jgi:hypothetical protein